MALRAGKCLAWAMAAAASLVVPAFGASDQDANEAPEPALEVHEHPKTPPENQPWNIHGQGTVVWQGHGRIRSPYQGDNSLNGGGQGRETVSSTAAIGVRLWQGGEIYFNPEAFQGFGLQHTHGLGGFSNGEAQRGGNLYPRAYVARAFMRQTFEFGGEKQFIRDDFNQLGGTVDFSRLSITSGKFAVNDVFDRNSVSQDARDGFLNYAMWEAGAFDYAADQKGYGAGTVVDFNQKYWAFRSGYFLLPKHANAQTLSWNVAREGQAIAELELRYHAGQMPGTLRLLGWHARANAGSYQQAALANDFDPEDSLAATRKLRSQQGYVVNLEQRLTDDLAMFSRWSWRDAKSEIMSWADMDRSLSLGLVLKGGTWGRPHDKIGLAGAMNRLSNEHALYSSVGGLSVTIGDGRLSYAGEKILETYYSIGLPGGHHNALIFDYQYIANPAYNTDRGPVSLFAVRLHGEF